MEITEAPFHAYPHACVVTGRDDGPVVDFAIEIGGVDPHLYLRLSVIEEAAALIGMVPKAEVDRLSLALDDIVEELVEAQKQLTAYAQVKEGLEALEGATA